MATRDIIENITEILAWPDLDGVPEDARSEAVGQADEEGGELAENLRLAWDEGGEDPLLTSLARPRDRMLAAERDPSRLIGYARAFTEPRPHLTSEDGSARRMSNYRVRTT